MKINYKIYKQVLEYIKHSEIYTFKNFVMENNLGVNLIQRGNDIIIHCPFHADEAPSCSLNDSLGGFKCFSCGRHGNYISFTAEYDRVIKGINVTNPSKANEFLRTDAIMQASIGYTSIYEKDVEKFELKDLRYNRCKFIKGSIYPTTYLEMATILNKNKASMQEKKLFILLMQHGLPIADIYNTIYPDEKVVLKSSSTDFDINKLLQFKE